MGQKNETLKKCEEHINTMLATIGYSEGGECANLCSARDHFGAVGK